MQHLPFALELGGGKQITGELQFAQGSDSMCQINKRKDNIYYEKKRKQQQL